MWARERCRISPPRFLAERCKRQLNQGRFVLLYFTLFTFSDLYWVCLSVFSCTVLFVSISQVIGCEDRLRNDLYCVEWGVKLYSNQPILWWCPLCQERAIADAAVRRWLFLAAAAVDLSSSRQPRSRVTPAIVSTRSALPPLLLQRLHCYIDSSPNWATRIKFDADNAGRWTMMSQ